MNSKFQIEEHKFNLFEVKTNEETEIMTNILKNIIQKSNKPIIIFITQNQGQKVIKNIFNYSNIEKDLQVNKINLEAEAIYVKNTPNITIEEIIDKCLIIENSEYHLEYIFVDDIENIKVKKRKFNRAEKKSIYVACKLANLSDKLKITTITFKNKKEI